MSRFLKIFIESLCILLWIEFSVQLSLTDFLSVNQEQKERLDEFRELMVNQVPHDYMKKDVYLIRWLRDRDFNVAAAEKHLLKNLRWREENHIDSILQEDFTDYDADFQYNIEGCSKEGHLILTMRIGDWDLRKYALAGKSSQLMRYVDKIYEECDTLIRDMQEDGQNTTQIFMITDLKNFNLYQQGCAACLPIFLHDTYTYTNHYVGMVHKIFSVNTPEIALPIWTIIRNLLNKNTRDMLEIYGKNKAEWSSALGKEIDPSQLSQYFGGSRKQALDLQVYRASGKVYKCG